MSKIAGDHPPDRPAPGNPPWLSNMAGLHAPLFKILLVILLGAVELGARDNLGHDRALEPPGLLERGFGLERGGLLLGVVEENCRAILGADIGTLPVRRRWIV